MKSHLTMKTRQLVPLPAGAQTIPCKWIFQEKSLPSGTKYKSCLCARGDRQCPGIDFTKKIALVAKFNMIKTISALANQHGWTIHHHDVKTAFLNRRVHKVIYMKQPLGYVSPGQEAHICKLLRSLYGLRQSPRQWHSKFHKFLQKHLLSQLSQDGNLYYLRKGGLILNSHSLC